jgi:arginine decarboxylase
VRGTGRTGYEVYAAVREAYDAQLELATHATVVLVLGAAQPAEDLERFAYDFEETIGRISVPGTATALYRSTGSFYNEVAMSPRDAFLGRTEVVPIEQAEGRVSSETIAGYPPGIPALLPGERVTREAIDYLHELVSAGARLHGASDSGLRSMFVVAEGG